MGHTEDFAAGCGGYGGGKNLRSSHRKHKNTEPNNVVRSFLTDLHQTPLDCSGVLVGRLCGRAVVRFVGVGLMVSSHKTPTCLAL